MKREDNSKYKNDEGVKAWKENLSIAVVKIDKWLFSGYQGFTASRKKEMVKERNN